MVLGFSFIVLALLFDFSPNVAHIFFAVAHGSAIVGIERGIDSDSSAAVHVRPHMANLGVFDGLPDIGLGLGHDLFLTW